MLPHVSSLFFVTILENQLIIDRQLLTALLKGHAVHLLALDGIRNVIRVDLDHVVVSFFLLMKDLQSLLGS